MVLIPRGNGAFQSTVIICPPGGWGTDVEEDQIYTLARQLGGTRVGVYSRFGSMMDLCDCHDEYIEYTNFRQAGILDEVDFTGDDTPVMLLISKRSLQLNLSILILQIIE